MKGIFTILNYYFSPGRWAAQWPLTTAPAAVGDRNLHISELTPEQIQERNRKAHEIIKGLMEK